MQSSRTLQLTEDIAAVQEELRAGKVGARAGTVARFARGHHSRANGKQDSVTAAEHS